MSGSCSSEPVSWLALERYALGELPPPRAAQVAAHLAGCPVCRTCLERIQGDARPLPPLPAAARAVAAPALPWWQRWRLGLALGGLAAAAAALLLVLRPPVGGDGSGGPGGIAGHRAGRPAGTVAIKGGGVLVLGLVRERGGAIARDPAGFAAGDRFKILVTCPPAASLYGDVVVYQPDTGGLDAAFPLPAAPLPCGNRSVLAGAFSITGAAPATVCLVIGHGGPPDRAALRASGPAGLAEAACARLDPERPARPAPQ